MEIKVLGPGCANCRQMEKEVFNALAELDIAANIEKVKDVKKIVAYGVMATPALVINEKVKLSGRVPKREELKRLITEEL